MRNIEELLEGVFQYKRDVDPIKDLMVKTSLKQINHGYLNVRVESPRHYAYGIIPTIGSDRWGKTRDLWYYSANKNWSWTGEPLAVPGLEAFTDCAFFHLGVIVNCLAYMDGGKFNNLYIVQLADKKGNNVYKLKSYRPDIASLFMSKVCGVPEERQEEKILTKNDLLKQQQGFAFSGR